MKTTVENKTRTEDSDLINEIKKIWTDSKCMHFMNTEVAVKIIEACDRKNKE